jgi:integrase
MIRSKAERARLAARREPYWARIEKGRYVGYRKLAEGEGTWIARLCDDGNKQRYRALGHQPDYDAAVRAARLWFEQAWHCVDTRRLTVTEACQHYVEHLQAHKGSRSAKDAEGRFRRLVYESGFGNLELDKLRSKDTARWLHAQIAADDDEEDRRRARDSANRNLTSLKAALNLALKSRMVATDAGWKSVIPYRGVGKRRERFLSLEERRRLLDACPDDLRLLVKALLLTGARPGEIATATVGDFDRALGTLALEGKTGRRIVSLSTEAIRFFREASLGKIGQAPLLSRADGLPWTKEGWKKPFRGAVSKAGLSTDVVVYTVRHTAISEMIAAGMDSFVVARLAGTSTAMIDKHYGHLRHDRTRARLDAVTLV